MKKPELLAPAGDLNRLKWALKYGADAVYIGGKDYSLRANANNFSDSELFQAVEYAHGINKKVYVTVNMLFHNDDLKNVIKYLKYLEKIKIDGIIISDLGILNIIKKNNILLKLILSTQSSVTNYETAKIYESLGFKKIVLARECSKEDIVRIKKETNLEIETFIHGAMCTSYSGRCLLSNYITHRDSNRGGCAQVCRFTFYNQDVENFSISSKDLNMIDYISDMIDINIDSFKIEGRMKSLYYIATVVDAYRNIIDKKVMNNLSKKDIEYYKLVLSRVSNRENAPQFYNNEYGKTCQYFTGREEISNQDFLGIVKSYDKKNNIAIIEQRNNFSIGDEIEVFGPKTKVFSDKIINIKNDKDIELTSAKHAQEIIKININSKVKEGDIIRVKLT